MTEWMSLGDDMTEDELAETATEQRLLARREHDEQAITGLLEPDPWRAS